MSPGDRLPHDPALCGCRAHWRDGHLRRCGLYLQRGDQRPPHQGRGYCERGEYRPDVPQRMGQQHQGCRRDSRAGEWVEGTYGGGRWHSYADDAAWAAAQGRCAQQGTGGSVGVLPYAARAQYPTAPGFATARSLNQIITYDAYNKAEAFLTQPLQIVAGSVAGSKWMSDDLYNLNPA
jgi:hypothetical protein